jgi:ethanolaminephosphotransferase
MVPCLPMFFSTWETYHTHTLYLGYFNGPTEGLIGACLFMIASAVYGPSIWSEPLYPHLPAALQGLYPAKGSWAAQYVHSSTNVKDIWVVFILTTFLIAHVPECVSNVHRARKAKGLPTLPLLLEWTPMVLFTGGCTAWLGSPYSALLRNNHLVLFSLTMSLVFGRMTTKIILAHLTRQPFPYWTMLLVPLLLGGLVSNLPLVGLSSWTDEQELWYLRGYFVFAAIVYGRWAFLVITAICRHLGINALTIPKEKIREAERKQAAERYAASNGSAAAPSAEKQNERIANGTNSKKAV